MRSHSLNFIIKTWHFNYLQNHCDYLHLERFLFSSRVWDSKLMTRSDLYEDYRSRKLKTIFSHYESKNPLMEFHHKYSSEVTDLEEDFKSKLENLDESFNRRQRDILERNNDMEFTVLRQRMEIAERHKAVQEERKRLDEEINSWEEKVFNISLQSKLNKRRKHLNLNGFVTRKLNNSSQLWKLLANISLWTLDMVGLWWVIIEH